MALVSLALSSCMGDGYADPDFSNGAPYGDNEITETNVLSIADLRTKYNTTITGNSYVKIDEDIKIKGIVTGNDIGGNIYNEVAVQDATGAILVCINASGLYGYMPVGQEILISLKGMYIGGYGKQMEVGGVYTNIKNGSSSIGKIDRYEWANKYKLIGTANPIKVEAMRRAKVVSDVKELNLDTDAAKLVTLKNVKFADADGKTVFAPNDGSVSKTANAINRGLKTAEGKNISTNSVVVRTSTYAKFANNVLPSGTVDITGIFTRYNNVWQILVRDENDIIENLSE